MANQHGLALTSAVSRPRALFWLVLVLFVLSCLGWVACFSCLRLARLVLVGLAFSSCFSALSCLVSVFWSCSVFAALCVSGPRGGVLPFWVGLLVAWLACGRLCWAGFGLRGGLQVVALPLGPFSPGPVQFGQDLRSLVFSPFYFILAARGWSSTFVRAHFFPAR